MMVLKKFSMLSYTRRKDDALQGGPGLRSLHKWLSRPHDSRMRLRGGKDSLGFLFLFELMTSRSNLKILPSDDPFNWGALLMRMMPVDDWAGKSGSSQSGDVLLSVLRCMANNPGLVRNNKEFPIFEDKRRFKMSTMFRGSNHLQTLLKSCKEFLGKHQHDIHWPQLRACPRQQARGGSRDTFRHYEPPIMIRYRSAIEVISQDRTLVAPRVPDYLCDCRVLRAVEFEGNRISLEEIAAFAGQPLVYLGKDQLSADGGSTNGLDDYVIRRTRAEDGLDLLPETLPFDVSISEHPSSRTTVARAILSRVEEDVGEYARAENTGTELYLCNFETRQKCMDLANIVLSNEAGKGSSHRGFLKDLLSALVRMHTKDSRFMNRQHNRYYVWQIMLIQILPEVQLR